MRLSKILWCSILNHFYQKIMKLLVKIAKKLPPPVGFEPMQFRLVARRFNQLSYWALSKIWMKIRWKSQMSTLFLNLSSDGHLRTNWYIKYTSVKFHLINSAGVLGSYPAIVKICIQTRTDHRMIVWVLFYASSKFVSLL